MADRLERVKWRNWNVVLHDEQRDWWTPPAKLGSPKAFDLITDSKEEYPATALRITWNAGTAMKIAAEFQESLKEMSSNCARQAGSLYATKVGEREQTILPAVGRACSDEPGDSTLASATVRF